MAIMVYVARKRCGCIIAATVDDTDELPEPEDRRKAISDTLRIWVRCGYAVDRVAPGDVPMQWFSECPHVPHQRKLEDYPQSVVDAARKLTELGATIDENGIITNPKTGQRIQLP